MKNRTRKDIWLYRIIVAALGLTIVTSVGGPIALALGSAAIDGLAGFLVPTHLNR